MVVSYNKCSNCNKQVQSYESYDAGYHEGYRTRNYRTLFPFEERRIEVPEKSLRVLICQTCIKADPALHDFKVKKRIEFYSNEVINAKKYIDRAKKAKKKANEKIKELKGYISKLKDLRAKVKNNEVVTGEDIPGCPVKSDERY